MLKVKCWSNEPAGGFLGTEVCKPHIHILLSTYGSGEGKSFS